MTPSEDLLKQHYADLSGKGFFGALISYMLSGPVVAMVWEGNHVVKTGRKMLGTTNPIDSEPGTIRGDYCIDVGRNICHGSDSVESAKKEIALWFKDSLNEWKHHSHEWVYEKWSVNKIYIDNHLSLLNLLSIIFLCENLYNFGTSFIFML